MPIMCLPIVMLAVGLSYNRPEPFAPDGIGTPQHSTASFDTAQSGDRCGRVDVQVSSSLQVTAQFAAVDGCTYGLALIAAGQPTYTEGGRKLSLPVRIVNRGPSVVGIPVQVVLFKDSGSVVVPMNGGGVTPLNADSTGAAGHANAGWSYWVLSATAPFAVPDTSASRTLEFSLPARTEQVRFAFQMTAFVPDTARPAIPNVWLRPEPYTVTVPSPDDSSTIYFRDHFGVSFRPEVSGATVRNLLMTWNAEIVGGIPYTGTAGMYVIRVPDPGPTWTQVRALVNQLQAHLEVEAVLSLNYRHAGKPRGRWPTDRIGFLRQPKGPRHFSTPARGYRPRSRTAGSNP